jgi:hypothetical protein
VPQIPIPKTICLTRVVQRDEDGVFTNCLFPTHVILLLDSSSSDSVLIPVDCHTLQSKFRVNNLPPPMLPPHPASLGITIPLHQLQVPHLPSAALLFLHALLREYPASRLAANILPPEVVDEFPACGPMFDILSSYPDDNLRDMALFNQGLWRNVLATECSDASILKTARAAWTIVAEVRKIKKAKYRHHLKNYQISSHRNVDLQLDEK